MTSQDDAAAGGGTAAAGPITRTARGVEWRRDGHLVSTDPALLDFPLTAGVLAATYWATDISEQLVRQSVEGSLAFGMYEVTAAGPGDGAPGDAGLAQIGFARVISDRAVFAWIGDVFVVDSHQGRGLGLWLMQCVMAHPDLQGMRRWMLASTSARGLYAKIGFSQLAKPELFMEIYDPDIHRRR